MASKISNLFSILKPVWVHGWNDVQITLSDQLAHLRMAGVGGVGLEDVFNEGEEHFSSACLIAMHVAHIFHHWFEQRPLIIRLC